ncbi:hypothetical protein HYDPIDRAFT_85064 [Hydnomerulius pinastri MD-312]|nr:hypothetical protein HYDPIDRAFT_85064 [Hydnomerulius pinastri MD-312]
MNPESAPAAGSARPSNIVITSFTTGHSTVYHQLNTLQGVRGIMSLLTPSESHAFQSFLTSLDSADFSADWNMQLEISHEHMPPAHGKEALAKATKDLMSLDGEKWRYPLGPQSPPRESSATPVHRHPQAQTNPLSFLYTTRQQRCSGGNSDETEQASPLSARPVPSGSRSRTQQPPLHHVIDSATISSRTRAKAQSYDRRSSSSSQSPIDPSGSSSSSTTHTSTPVPASAKRSPPPDANISNKRHRSSNASQPLLGETQLLTQNRAALLSPSQKKANHIQSEQKRRANIRRGYDALCETVPALREACQAEDEQILANGKTKTRRRGKGKATNDDGEKVDGRAGPRSENVVLAKTIDYMTELLSEREALMQRLQVARSALPVDHPLLHRQPDAPPPLWERKWTGGESKEGDDDEEEDDED